MEEMEGMKKRDRGRRGGMGRAAEEHETVR
jgi:hypothetical protein